MHRSKLTELKMVSFIACRFCFKSWQNCWSLRLARHCAGHTKVNQTRPLPAKHLQISATHLWKCCDRDCTRNLLFCEVDSHRGRGSRLDAIRAKSWKIGSYLPSNKGEKSSSKQQEPTNRTSQAGNSQTHSRKRKWPVKTEVSRKSMSRDEDVEGSPTTCSGAQVSSYKQRETTE